MRPHPRSETGDTLIEVCISLVIIGIVASALFSTITTTTDATKAQRYVVSADAVLRDAAELTKAAVRRDCQGSALTYSVDFASIEGGAVAPPPDFSADCPTTNGAAATPIVPLTVTFPAPKIGGQPITKSLDIIVRTP